MERRTVRNVNGQPRIESIDPAFALPGGEVRINGSGLTAAKAERPTVMFGDSEGSIIVGTKQFIVARVPEGAASGEVVVSTDGKKSNAQPVGVAATLAESLHPVANPAIDDEGNVYATFSGSRGQKAPIAIYRIDLQQNVKPFVQEMMNATGLAFGRDGSLYVSSRYDGTVYRVARNGATSSYAEGMAWPPESPSIVKAIST